MRARIAWLLAGVTLVLVVVDALVTAQYRPLLSEAAVAVHGFPFVNGAVLGCAVMGALILSRDQRHPVGWLLMVVGVTSALSIVCEAYSVWVVTEGGPGSRSLGGVFGWVSVLVGGQLAIGAIALMFLLAPDGRLLSRRWRHAARGVALGELMCAAALLATNPARYDVLARTDAEGGAQAALYSAGFLLICVGLLGSLVSILVRWRRAQGEQRQQVRVIAASAVLVSIGLLALVVVQIFNGGRQTWAASLPLYVSFLLLPVLFAIAVLRYRLYDIEVIINRTVVVAVGSAFAGIGYAILVVAVGTLVDRQTGGFWLSLLGTALVALAFQPLRRRVIRFANRLAFGSRAQPYEALSEFSRRLAETPAPGALLPAVAEAAGRAVSARRATATLEVSGVAVVAADWGDDAVEGMDSHVVPVRHGDTVLGRIEVCVPKGRPLRASDERLLRALANQAAVAFRNTALGTQLAVRVEELDRTTHELARSRSRIIEADAAARRALEAAISRDVLPHLVSLPVELARARAAVVEGVPTNGIDLLVASTNTALESLRELTRGVFPTQLAKAGLEPALRTLLARNGPAPALSVDPSAAGLRFSSRVEAAVYFCCAEATRSAPRLTSVELSLVGAELVLRVQGGAGAAVDRQAMLDRVAAAGGSLSTAPDLLDVTIPVDEDQPAYALPNGVGPGL
jgi:GAF domain-containing protein